MELIHAPNEYKRLLNPTQPAVFLAGSIEMGKAADWQTELAETLKHMEVTLLNPRRPDWDDSWEQTIEDDQFREQVEWELDGMEGADIIFVYLDPKTKAPISLMEIGLHAPTHKRMIVCCPEGFYRKGNVDIVCKRHNVIMVDDLDKATTMLEAMILMWEPAGTKWELYYR